MRRKGFFWLVLGLALAISAFVLLSMWRMEERAAEQSVSAALRQLEECSPSHRPEMQAEERELPGVLVIPALDLRLPVAEEWSDAALQQTPCRYVGSAEGGGLVIAGHNYDAHFGRLRQLSAGETVIFTDWQGCCHSYRVTAAEILRPAEVEKMVGGEWALTLFTCTPGGQRRFALRCEAVSGEEKGE